MAAITNNLMHTKFGQRGIAIVGPSCHLISYIVLSLHPPYPVLVISMYLSERDFVISFSAEVANHSTLLNNR
jgi:hypothetical protein